MKLLFCLCVAASAEVRSDARKCTASGQESPGECATGGFRSSALLQTQRQAVRQEVDVSEDLLGMTEAATSEYESVPEDNPVELFERTFWGWLATPFVYVVATVTQVVVAEGVKQFDVKGAVEVGKQLKTVTTAAGDFIKEECPPNLVPQCNAVADAVVTVGREVVEQLVVPLGNQLLNVGNAIQAEFETTLAEMRAFDEKITSAVDTIGEQAKLIGTAAIGLAQSAKQSVTEMLSCFEGPTLTFDQIMCKILLRHCDCDSPAPNGSWVRFSGANGELNFRCTKPAGLVGTFTFEPSGDDKKRMNKKKKKGLLMLPGKRKKKSDTRRRRTASKRLKGKRTKAPRGSCKDRELSFALESTVDIVPFLEVSAKITGEQTIKIGGEVVANIEALLEAEGHCDFAAQRNFPEKPKFRTFCVKFFCVVLGIQGVVDMQLTGNLGGSVRANLEATWGVEAVIELNINGATDATVTVKDLKHRHSVDAAGSLDFTLQFSTGPHLMVFPLPGVPVDMLPKVTLEVKGYGELEWKTGGASLLELGSKENDFEQEHAGRKLSSELEFGVHDTDVSAAEMHLGNTRANRTSLLDGDKARTAGCAAIAMNIFTATKIAGVGLPSNFRVVFGSQMIEDAIIEGASTAAAAMTAMMDAMSEQVAGCFPGVANVIGTVTSAMNSAVAEVGNVVRALIPDFDIDFGIDQIVLFAQTHLCATLAQSQGADACGSVTCQGAKNNPSSIGNSGPLWVQQQAEQQPRKMQVYLRMGPVGSGLAIHTEVGGTKKGEQTLHPCPRSGDHANCVFELILAPDGEHYYIKARDEDKYVHASGGTKANAQLNLHACPVEMDYPNCQWKFEQSKTKEGFYYIKSKGGNFYAHAAYGGKTGNSMTLHSCGKSNDYPNCQWLLEPRRVPNGQLVYLRVGTGAMHTQGGTASGAEQTWHSCEVSEDHMNCVFELIMGPDKEHYYIKARDANLYVHASGGNKAGAQLTLHPCEAQHNYPNCQWKFEESGTKPGFWYIKSKGVNQYAHSSGFKPGGKSKMSLHPCGKAYDYPTCQWQIQPRLL